MINSNNTQRNSDHDFTKLRKRALGNQGGVESKEQFIFDNDTKKLSAGSDIATAYILCTRPASNPIPNQKFLAQFEFTGSLDFLNITNGDKIFIEIKENLVKDPTLIEDLDNQTNYNQGLGIWEIKIAKNYPNHSNYLKLYEWNDGKLVDLRKTISISALDSVSQRTTSLEEKVGKAEEKIEKLEESGASSCLEYHWIFGDKETRVPAAPSKKKAWLCVNAKRIRFTARYLQSGVDEYLNSMKIYDENWTMIPTSEYVSPPAYINWGAQGSCNAGSILEFKQIKKISEIEITTYASSSYYMNADPVIDLDEGDSVWINCLWMPKNSFWASQTKKFTLTYPTPKEPNQVSFVRQRLPLYEVCELELNLGKDTADKEIHIQRLSSGIPSDKLSLKLKKVQLPITDIEVEVRKGIIVDIDTENCYWYGGELLASGVITKNGLFTRFWRINVKLNKTISLPKGGLYSVVLRQAGGVVNAVNYYQIGCDTTQRSTAFGAVKVNGGTRTHIKRIPFCESDAFLEEAIVHYRTKNDEPILAINSVGNPNDWAGEPVDFFCPIDNPYLSFTVSVWYAWGLNGISLIQDGKTIGVDKNKPFQRVALKRWPAKIKVEGYKATIVNVKFLFGSNTEELKVVAKNWEHYILGKSYGFGLAGFFNDKRIGPQIDTANPSTSATTGTIAPGNYVSYLTVIGPDGKKYKIWAYAE